MSLPVHAEPTAELGLVTKSVPRNDLLNSAGKDRNNGDNQDSAVSDQEALHNNRRKRRPPTRNDDFLWV
jgi:hypothetical protein